MTHSDDDSPPLWQFVPLAQYTRPPEPATEKMRRGIRAFWDRLKHPRNMMDEAIDQKSLQKMRGEDFNWIAPAPQWSEGIPALDECLQDWLAYQGNFYPLKVVVAPPHSGVRQMIEGWAATKKWRTIEPPDPREILAGKKGLHRDVHAHGDIPIVLSSLEKWYLRHHNGLEIMRELLDHLASRQEHTLICCDSWAWAYLKKTVQADLAFPSPITLAAFHGQSLSRWFGSLVRLDGETHCVFRHPKTEKVVLDTSDSYTHNEENDRSDFLTQTAASSRGIPGVAHALWRHSLRLGLEDAEAPQDREREASGRESSTCPRNIRVIPWQKLDTPSVPKGDSRFAFLLHTLLLHDGVSTTLLPPLVQSLTHPLAEGLKELQASGMVDHQQDTWRVTPLGYPAARRYLLGEEYLVDDF